MSDRQALIIGAGIVGISCGLYLQKQGYRVTLADPGGLAGGASYGNAGVLAVSECLPLATPELIRQLPKLLLDKNSPLTLRWLYAPKMTAWFYRFLKAAKPQQVARAAEHLSLMLQHSAAAHDELAQWADCRDRIRQTGWIKAFEHEHSFQAAKSDFRMMEKYGVRCDYLNAAALQAQQPNLAPIFKHAVNNSDCRQIINPGGYVRHLGEHFLQNGGRLLLTEIDALQVKNGTVQAACSQTEQYRADVFVIAAGAWSKKLSSDVGTYVPLDTERGYHIEFAADDTRLADAPVFWAEQSVVMSPGGGKLRVTSSVEFAGLQRRADFRKLTAQIADIRRSHRHPLGEVVGQWLGFRPSIPDSLPVIGRASGADNAFLAFGHGHLGLTLGPLTGRLIAGMIAGKIPEWDLSAYSPSRFGR
ncbi:NAD(P)/FAD-dependent oxidoreductase [Neisseria yangbaofengii]|uniref:NAD(P)/FAD-dependent oxidoreductase n=1 Tax=Neisseria yangbaofengii TaxID=2709396 RepID=UPI0013EA5615|nr:FAD-dependent oxidoreductase [Neisseria yangbaofengii]